MAEETVPSVRRYTAIVVACTVGLFVVLVLLRGVAGMMADSKRMRVLGAWAGTLGSFEEIRESYPDREANESALRVEELSAALGIDVTPHWVEDRARPTDAAETRYEKVRIAIGHYANRQLERAGPVADPPPVEVTAYLDEHQKTLAELRRQLTEGDPPHWSRLLERPDRMPMPNLRGLIKLQRLLVAEAMFRADAGDSESALATLEASWRLNTALRDSPILVTQLTGLDIARTQAGALRHVEHVPRSWNRRLYEHDFRASILTSLEVEGWAWMQAVDPQGPDVEEMPGLAVLVTLVGPYLRYCATDLSEEWRRALLALSELDSICDRDLEASGFSLRVDPAAWNFVARKTWMGETDGASSGISRYGFDGVVLRLARYELDREMTAKILELRQARDDDRGHWPADLPGIEQSPTCPGDRWIYEATPRGQVSLAFSRTVDWEELRGANLPLRYVANP